MKLIVSSDKKFIVNADMVNRFYVFYWDGMFRVRADKTTLSSYKTEDTAKKELWKLSNCIVEGPCVYQMEDSIE